MEDFLHRIVADIRLRRQGDFSSFSQDAFLKELPTLPPPQPHILQGIEEKFFLIAECKQASPSQGILCDPYDPVAIARAYQAGGASAVSVLTEEKFFRGSSEHLRAVRKVVTLPLLWKDFVIHEEQVAAARRTGADMLLLIFRILPGEAIHRLLEFTLASGLLPLVEVFRGDDPEAIIDLGKRFTGKFLLGINNRDLASFHTDLSHGHEMFEKLSPLHREFSFISESGIRDSQDIHRIKEIGFRGALVGESLVRQASPQQALQALLS